MMPNVTVPEDNGTVTICLDVNRGISTPLPVVLIAEQKPRAGGNAATGKLCCVMFHSQTTVCWSGNKTRDVQSAHKESTHRKMELRHTFHDSELVSPPSCVFSPPSWRGLHG